MNRHQRDEVAEHLRAGAHAYARRLGWAVFPLVPDGKAPALSSRDGGHGCLDATTDPAVIDRMWRRFPAGNIGLACGRPSGLYVVDIDPRHGGQDTIDALTAAHGPIPHGPTQATPSGGRHHLFRWRDGLGNTAGALGPGVDTRGTGGYIAAAPSRLPAGFYTWLVHLSEPLPELPHSLTPPPPKTTPLRRPKAVATAGPDRVLAGLVNVVLAAPQGTRNAKLFWAACRLGEHAAAGRVSLDEGAAALLDAAAAVGLPDAEANRTLDSAVRRTLVPA